LQLQILLGSCPMGLNVLWQGQKDPWIDGGYAGNEIWETRLQLIHLDSQRC
jgi:hypothetical protein